MYYIEQTALYPARWVDRPAGYRAKSVAVRCGVSGSCPACNVPALQLAAVRAVLAVDAQRAQRSAELFDKRAAAREAVRW